MHHAGHLCDSCTAQHTSNLRARQRTAEQSVSTAARSVIQTHGHPRARIDDLGPVALRGDGCGRRAAPRHKLRSHHSCCKAVQSLARPPHVAWCAAMPQLHPKRVKTKQRKPFNVPPPRGRERVGQCVCVHVRVYACVRACVRYGRRSKLRPRQAQLSEGARYIL